MAASRFVSYLACAAAIMLGASGQQVQAQNWDGSGLVKFGVFLQGSMVDYDIKQLSAGGAQSNFKASPDGFGVGISAGYDLRLGSFIIGAEADVSLDDGGARSKPATGESYGIDYFSTLRGRFGYVVHPSLTVYGTAGYSMLGAEYKLNGFTSPGGTAGAGNKKYGTLGGFVYGGGAEYDMGWGIGFLEYLHSDIGAWNFTGFQGNRVDIDGKQDVIRLGLKFKVGHDHSHDVYRAPGGLK